MNTSRNFMNRRKRGFTLIELLVVMVVIAILALIVVPQFGTRSTQAREANLRSNLRTMRHAIQTYKIDVGSSPADLNKLITDSSTGWKGPYITSPLPQDPTAASATGNNGNWTYSATSTTINSATTGYTAW